MKLVIFIMVFIFGLNCWSDSLTSSLVRVSSEYFNVINGQAPSKVRLQGAGLLFKLKESNRQFVLTASHLSSGSIPNSLIINTDDGHRFKVLSRISDNLRDLEVIEVEPYATLQPLLSYEVIDQIGMLDKFCAPLIPWDDSSRLIYSQTEKTRIFLPFPSWVLKPNQQINSLDFYDRFALASPRVTYDGLYTREFISESRFNSVYKLDESVIDNPVRAGMSGLPIFAEVSEKWDDTSPRSALCLISLVQAYHRLLPRSFGASINQIQKIVRRAIQKDIGTDPVKWSMESGLTYRHDTQSHFREALFTYSDKKERDPLATLPAGASMSLDGGSGASVDGGSGASVDGGSGASVDGGNSHLIANTLNLNPGVYDEKPILAYQLENQTIFADSSSYRFTREKADQFTFTHLPYPAPNNILISLLQSRLKASNEEIRQQLYRSHQLIKWTIEDFEARSYFEGHLENIGSAMTQWPLRSTGSEFLKLLKEFNQNPWYGACVIDAADLSEKGVTIRLINNATQKKATDYIYFKVNLKGQLVSYYDGQAKEWVQTDTPQAQYLPFELPKTNAEDQLYVDVKGLLFMDIHDAFKHINRNPEYGLRQLDRMMKKISQAGELITNYKDAQLYFGTYEDAFDFFQLDRNIKFLTAFVEHLESKTKLFAEEHPQTQSIELSPYGDLLSRMAHIVVTPARTGMSWPILCTSQDIDIP